MSQHAAAAGGTQRAAGQETILARGGVPSRNDASSPSHVHGEKSPHASPSTVTPYLLIWFLLSHLSTLLVLA